MSFKSRIEEHKKAITVILSFSLVISILTVGFLVWNTGTSNILPNTTIVKTALPTIPPIDNSPIIAQENALPGTSAWMLDKGAIPNFIQDYLGVSSVLPGGTVPVYVSSPTPVKYIIQVYRLGWYSGLGGKFVTQSPELTSLAQGYWYPGPGLLNCKTCVLTPATHTIDANWKVSYQLKINTDWLSGVYLLKFVAHQLRIFAESFATLIVRNDSSRSTFLVDYPTNTDQAYNYWGGYSTYIHATKSIISGDEANSFDRAPVVSFNRPYWSDDGAGTLFDFEIDTIRYLERSGYNVTYTTDVNLSENPQSMLNHKAVIIMGHDEYWTVSMRDGAETAIKDGVSFAFLGANDCYWQSRYLPDMHGNKDRLFVSYKVKSHVSAFSEQLKLDPDYATQPSLVTTMWRDTLIKRPENAMMGLMYLSYFSSGKYAPDWVVAQTAASSLFLTGTGLYPGEHIKGGLLGYEVDGVVNNGFMPKDEVILSQSPVVDAYKHTVMASTGYYYAPSGALVFDAGSIWWSWGLDDLSPPGVSKHLLHGNASIQALTTNILNAMVMTQTTSAHS